jgi:hypothetical protein
MNLTQRSAHSESSPARACGDVLGAKQEVAYASQPWRSIVVLARIVDVVGCQRLRSPSERLASLPSREALS